MSKTKATDAAGKTSDSGGVVGLFNGTIRETLESVVIAFILAFLFRSMVAEAFVIPTGSMAPTLQGQHKDFKCDQCKFRYRVGASSESDDRGHGFEGVWYVGNTTCPNCRFTYNEAKEMPTWGGDRILVAKFPFDFFPETFGEPRRWDVTVFKYPENATDNYIKRLIGLPGEFLQISRGDIHTSRDGGKTYQIERKPESKIRPMLQAVYDNDFQNATLHTAGWPYRWNPDAEISSPFQSSWQAEADHKAYQVSASQPGETAWLRYTHTVPQFNDWSQLKIGNFPANWPIQPELISDFYAYNTGKRRDENSPILPDVASEGLNWVGDLAIDCEVKVEKAAGTAIFELVKAGHRFQAVIDLSSGKATLNIDDGRQEFSETGNMNSVARPTGETKMSGPGTYSVVFANVDEQLHLWVNDKLVAFNGPTTYNGLNTHIPTPADLSPASIGSQGGNFRVSHLKILRDVYYIANTTQQSAYASWIDRDMRNQLMSRSAPIREYLFGPILQIQGAVSSMELASQLQLRHKFFSDPSSWPQDFAQLSQISFELKKFPGEPEKDQFFMLGDNSPSSADSRLWKKDYSVARELLVGKALFIFWPHSFHEIPGTEIPFPYFPNFSRMGFVR